MESLLSSISEVLPLSFVALGVKGISIAPCSWRYCNESRTGVNILRMESEVVVYRTRSSLGIKVRISGVERVEGSEPASGFRVPPGEVNNWSWMGEVLRKLAGCSREQPNEVVFLLNFSGQVNVLNECLHSVLWRWWRYTSWTDKSVRVTES